MGFNTRQGLLKGFWLVNIFFACILCFALWFSYNQRIQNAKTQGENITQTLEKSISSMLGQIDLSLVAIVDELEHDLADGKIHVTRINKTSEKFFHTVKFLTRLTYSDAQGNVPADIGFPLVEKAISVEDREYFQQLKANSDVGLVTSKPIIGRAVGKLVLVFARAYKNPAGKFAGVAYVSVELENFSKLFGKLQLGKGAVTNLISDNDYLNLALYPAPKDPSVVGKRILVQNIIDQMKQDKPFASFIEISNVDNVEKIYSLRKLSDSPYFILLGQSIDDILALWRKQVVVLTGIMLLFLGMTGMAMWQLRRGWREQEIEKKYTDEIIKLSPFGICIYDREGQCISANEAMLAHIGGTMQKVLALNYHQVESWKKYGIYELACHTQQTGKASEITVHAFSSFGKEVWLSMAFSALETDRRMMLTTYDLSEFKQEQQTRQEAEEQYRSLISVIPEGVVLQDENSVIIAHNESAERILGLSADQINGRTSHDPLWNTIHEDGSPFPGETHPAVIALKSGQPQTDVIMGINKPDGKLTWISINVQPIFKEGKATPHQIVATMHDITERKRSEKEAIELREQLAQATKMESIGHLTAGIAHDFNNMLGAMMGYTELSQHMLAAGKPEAVLPYQVEIFKAGTRAKELIAQMLAFSRTSSDNNDEKAPVSLLTPIVKEVVAMLRSSIPSTVSLNYQIEAEDLKVRIQPVHLHQIILNLGVNARDAMGEYGKIDVTLSRYHGDDQLCSACKNHFSGDFAQITIADSGSGIPESVLDKIFEPFFTTKGVGKGTGMGLSVVHGLVRAAGGHIQVESSATDGTRFKILLPMELSAPGLQETVEDAKLGNIKGIRIMLVDDEMPLATMLHEYLVAYGAHVVSFTDPIKALGIFSKNAGDIDLLITDEAMPGISGMLLAEKFLKIRPDLAIILCTGYSDHATPESVKQIGIASFFHKPLNMRELMNKIQELCGAVK